ncbi:CBS domain-containing protein, partial [Candidatus Woesearchaeota archaeon]|nr:CBS domain-containing protein [Candidatus Woesearchaeota archaeon]
VLQLPEAKKLKVRDIKLVKPTRLSHDDSLGKAVTIMQDEHVDHVPIFYEGKLHGVLSFRDVLRHYLNWSPDKDYSARFNAKARIKIADGDLPSMISLPVSTFSTNENLLTVNSASSLGLAVSSMLNHRIHDLLVMDFEQEFKGMLTVRNILRKVSTLGARDNFTIQFVGLKEARLKPSEKETLVKLTQIEAAKLARRIKQDVHLVVHIKTYGKKEEGREKFSISVRLESFKPMIISTHIEWNPEIALRFAFDHVRDEVIHKISRQLSKDKIWE